MSKFFPEFAEDDDVQAEILSGKALNRYFEDQPANSGTEPNNWSVFDSGNNKICFFKSRDAAIEYRNNLFKKWHGSGICPRILVSCTDECSLVF